MFTKGEKTERRDDVSNVNKECVDMNEVLRFFSSLFFLLFD